ncbi:ABC transporter permease [Bacillus suaedae]|uniref:ABC transporter permease n=1 Tax=Halalkalibacter suaedae TaxID=2822140 RepID=A0A941AQ64_9BACI|nr:ABC transporter permease [Bacillus suaedae]MBP3953545.1 ABC transporter permease [Bacillus suaedae]
MNLFIRLIKTLIMWFSLAVILILIILLPRNTESYRDGNDDVMSYQFTWDSYKDNVIEYISNVWSNKSIGITNYNQTFETELIRYGTRTLFVFVPALLLSIVFGIYKGVFDYRHRTGLWRVIGQGGTWVTQSVPDFFLILLIQLLLSMLHRWGLPQIDLYGDEHWYNFILPALFLSMYPAALIARYTTEYLENEEYADYIKTAEAKGVPEKSILWNHVLRNCWTKLIQHFLPITLTLVSSMFVVEYMTMYNGMGTRLIKAIQIKDSIIPGQSLPIDIPVVIGFSLIFMFIFMIVQLISQILLHVLSPVRGEGLVDEER